MTKSMSRRSFLMKASVLMGLTAASGALAACGATPAPAATPTAAAKPTTAPAVAATPTSAAAQPTAAATVAPAATQPAAASGQQVTLTMWKGPHKAAGDETKLCAGPTLEKFMAANPNIKVDFQEIPWNGYNEKFTSAFAAGQPPDVSYQTESFPTFVKAGNILPLDDLMAQSNFDKKYILDRAWGLAQTNGVTYAMPWIEGGSFMLYNKDLFKKAGLDPETPPDTMDDFLSYAKKITALGNDTYGYAVNPKEWHENGQWNIRWGGRWFNDDLTQCVADSKEAMGGWQFLSDLFNKDKVALPAAVAEQEPGAWGYFRDGKVGMITAQSPQVNSLRQEKPDFPLGGCFVPKGPAPEPAGRAAYGGVGMLAIAKATKHVQESWTLLNWLVTPDALKSWIGCLGFSCAAANVFLFEGDPIISIAEKGRQFHFFWPYTDWIFKFWDLEATYIEAILLGQRTVDEGIKELVSKVNDLLKASATG